MQVCKGVESGLLSPALSRLPPFPKLLSAASTKPDRGVGGESHIEEKRVEVEGRAEEGLGW